MKLLDLFSGIGGFSLAGKWTGKIKTVCFVENNKFCQKVLNKNFPKVPIINDIKEFTIQEYEEKTGLRTADIISGGFPCQPFSISGKRKGTEDNRYLWKEMFRVIQLIQPKWIVAENVYGLLNIEGGLVFENICTDLERENYEVQTFIIPAASLNAPHKRDRVWIIAQNTGYLDGKRETQKNNSKKKDTKKNAIEFERPVGCNNVGIIANTDSSKRQFLCGQNTEPTHKRNSNDNFRGGTTSNTEARGNRRLQRKGYKEKTIISDCWERNWIEVATEFCGMDDGLSDRLHKNRNRIDRLKVLGNAIVPQVAYQIFKAILESENKQCE
jgi:DNA (cytosine-5)-methyltransferase 1